MGQILTPKCPRCHAKPCTLTEMWEGHAIEFGVNADGSIEKDGYMSDGAPVKIYAKCGKCAHTWTVRRAIQIVDFKQYQEIA